MLRSRGRREVRYVIGAEADEELLAFDREPEPLDAGPGRTADAPARADHRPAQGRPDHAPQHRADATTFGWHTSVVTATCTYTLPMFHCNGWV